MVREMTRKAKLLRSFANTMRWTSTWRNSVAAAVRNATPPARADGLSDGPLGPRTWRGPQSNTGPQPIIDHPMKLLHVTPFYEPAWAYGGMVRAVAGLCRALAKRGHDVTVLTALLDSHHPRLETRDGVRVRRLPAFFSRGMGHLLAKELSTWRTTIAPRAMSL